MVAPNGRRDRRVRRDDGEAHVGRRERRGGVEAEPAEQEDERAEHRHRDVVRRQRARLPVGTELADPRPEDDRTRQAGDATHRVHDARSRRSRRSRSRGSRLLPSWLEPAAAPRPAAEERVVDRTAEQAPAHERLPLPALGHRPGRDRGRRVHEGDHVQEERGDRRRVRRAGEAEAGATPEERPVTEPDQPVGAAAPCRARSTRGS